MIIAQISDTHITIGGQFTAPDYDTSRYLDRAVTHLNHLPRKPDVVIVTGDCVETGSIQEYERFRELLSPLTVPIYVIPGNHDNRQNLQTVFGIQGHKSMANFIQYVVNEFPIRLIALDTMVDGSHAGNLCHERLHWLEERLIERCSTPTLIFLHHHPFNTGLKTLDSIGLESKNDLASIVGRYTNIKGVMCGHVHRLIQKQFHGTTTISCPSTAHQIYLDLQQPTRISLVNEPPACLLHVWDDDNGLLTHVSQIGEYKPFREIYDGNKWNV